MLGQFRQRRVERSHLAQVQYYKWLRASGYEWYMKCSQDSGGTDHEMTASFDHE